MSDPLRLQIDGLRLRAGALPHGRVLFDRLDAVVAAGQCWAVLGPNGAGKSSLLAALAGVMSSDSGRIVLLGRPLHRWPPRELADWRAWCPQFWTDPFPATVLQTLSLVRNRAAWWSGESAAPDAEVQQLLVRLDLAGLATADVRTLSGGERQRVAIATALLQDARLLLLDEPAAHLDLAHQRLLVDELRTQAARGRAVVASLHDLNLAADLSTHAILLDGRGGVVAGERDAVMSAERLSAAFGVAVAPVDVCGQRRFWVTPAGGGA